MSDITLHLKSSRQFAVLLCSAHVAVACILWKIDWPNSIQLAGTVLLVISLYLYLHYYALLRSPRSIVVLHLSEDGATCIAQTQSNQQMKFIIMGDTFVTPFLTVLCLKSLNSIFVRNLVIFSDGIDVEKFRQLRVWLRWKWKRINQQK